MSAVIRNFTRPTADGREAVKNDERAFWQSRMTRTGQRAEPPELTDIPQLARDIRAGFKEAANG